MQILRPVLAAVATAVLFAVSPPAQAQVLGFGAPDYDSAPSPKSMVTYVKSTIRPEVGVVCNWHSEEINRKTYMGRVYYEGGGVTGYFSSRVHQTLRVGQAMFLQEMVYSAEAHVWGWGQRESLGIGDAKSRASVNVTTSNNTPVDVAGSTLVSAEPYNRQQSGSQVVTVNRTLPANIDVKIDGSLRGDLTAEAEGRAVPTQTSSPGEAEASGRSWVSFTIDSYIGNWL